MFMVSLRAKYEIVKSYMQEIKPALNLTPIS